MIKIFNFKRLGKKIVFSSTIILIVVLSICAVINNGTQKQLLISQAMNNADMLCKSVALSLGPFLQSEKTELVQDAFDEIARGNGIWQIYFTDNSGAIKISSDRTKINTTVKISDALKKAKNSREIIVPGKTRRDESAGGIYSFQEAVKKTGTEEALGVLGLELDFTRLNNSVNFFRTQSLIITFLSVLIIIIFFMQVLRNSIFNPINKLLIEAAPISKGDLTHLIDIQSKDEVGQLSEIFNSIIKNLHVMVDSIRQTASKVISFSQEISTSAKEMNGSTQGISSTIQQIAKGVTTQVKRVEDTSRLLEEMANSIRKVSENAQIAVQNTDRSLNQAQIGDKGTRDAVEKMRKITDVVAQAAAVVKALGENSQQIGEITETITSIADQTNLLALNAAIEAARAGDAGRGFAVVAEEVRKLAEGSAEAARRIGALIKGIQEETPKAVSSIETGSKEVQEGAKIVIHVSNMFSEIISAAEQSAVTVTEITVAAHQQLKSSDEIVKAVEEVSSVAEESASAIEETSSSAEEQTAAMEELTASSEELARLALNLQVAVEKFKLLEGDIRKEIKNQKSNSKN